MFEAHNSEVKELLEKRNTLEMERIQLLDKIAELQISIARVHQGTNSETRSESGATLRKRYKTFNVAIITSTKFLLGYCELVLDCLSFIDAYRFRPLRPNTLINHQQVRKYCFFLPMKELKVKFRFIAFFQV